MYENNYGYIKDLSDGSEHPYSTLQDREYIISGIVEQGHDYEDYPTIVQTCSDFDLW